MAEASEIFSLENSDDSWSRVSPIALLYFIEKSIVIVANNVIYMLPILFALWDEIKANPWLALAIFLGLFALIIAIASLSFIFFRYRLFQGSVEVKSGVFFKKHVNLPFNRIQNVKIEQPFYYRPFSFASLAFDSGGSLNQEARLIALPLDKAQSLRKAINDIVKETVDENTPITDADMAQQSSDETVINTRSIGDLAMHGITSNRVYLLLAFVAPFIDEIIKYVIGKFDDVGFDVKAHIENDPTWQIGLYVLALFLIFLGIMTLLSIIGAIIMFYGYTLSKTKDKLIRRSGLINRHEVAVPISRIQVAIMKQDWLDTLFGRINLRLDQLNAQAQAANASAANNKLMVPSVFAYQCRDILADVLPNQALHQMTFLRIHSMFITRYMLWLTLPLTLAMVYLHVFENAMHWAVPALTPILLTGLIWLRWKRWGFMYQDEYVYIKKGLLGVDRYCLPIHKIQRVTISQSHWMKRQSVATLKLQIASGVYTIPLIDETIAKQIHNIILYQVEADVRSWM